MRLLLINPCVRYDSPRKQLPVGLGYIATAIQRAGHPFDLFDMDVDRFTVEDLDRFLAGKPAYDVVAFGCIVTGYKHAHQILAVARKHSPRGVLIVGNSVAGSIPRILLERTPADIAVVGEGDVTIVELLDRISRSQPCGDVDAIVYKEGDRLVATPRRKVLRSLDDLPFVNWDLFDVERYLSLGSVNSNVSREVASGAVRCFPINTARGCPHRCTFCYHVFREDPYRRRSVGNVIEEIRLVQRKYGVNFIDFWDELTLFTRKQAEELVDGLLGARLDLRWAGSVRGDMFTSADHDLLCRMKASGCDSLSYSLESADPAILRSMNKRMSVSQFVAQKRALDEAGLVSLTSLVFGMPGETPESIRTTLDVCRQLRLYPSAGFLLPQPGTEIYAQAREKGLITDEESYLFRIGDRQDLHINLTQMTDEQLYSEVERGLVELANELGVAKGCRSVFKTTTYQQPPPPGTTPVL
jgi:radical SAM superfamily enzyme YgiQ (UPF0313 family)